MMIDFDSPSSYRFPLSPSLIAILDSHISDVIDSIKKQTSSSRFFSDASPLHELLDSFTKLKKIIILNGSVDFQGILNPFISLFKSTETTGPVVSAALNSINAFLTLSNLFEFNREMEENPENINLTRALMLSISTCRFEMVDTLVDELALTRLLDTLHALARHSLIHKFSDGDVCAILDSVFVMSFENTISERLRQYASSISKSIIMILYEKLPIYLERRELSESMARMEMDDEKMKMETKENDSEKIRDKDKDKERDKSASNLSIFSGSRAHISYPMRSTIVKKEGTAITATATTGTSTSLAIGDKGEGSSSSTKTPSIPESSLVADSNSIDTNTTSDKVNLTTTDAIPINYQPFGLETLMEIQRFLLRLLDPFDKRNEDRMKQVAIEIFTLIIGKHGDILIRIEESLEIISNDLLHHSILALLSENPILTIPLKKLFGIVFSQYRRIFVPQFDEYISQLLSLLSLKSQGGAGSGSSNSGGGGGGGSKSSQSLTIPKEVYIDMLNVFLNDTDLISDLYVYHETNKSYSFCLKDLFKILTRRASIDSYALESLLNLLEVLSQASNMDKNDNDNYNNVIASPDELRKNRELKLIYCESARKFNKSPKEAFEFLHENNLLTSINNIDEIAKFLRQTPGLDKKSLGEYLSKPGNEEILKEFIRDFHLEGLSIDEALRLCLESFRLPGEAQQISRIMEAFAEIYFNSSSKGSKSIFKSQDAAYVLAYSTIMLNTDQHNRQVRHRMTVEDFIRNNRGINDGENFDEPFLRQIYQAIHEKEIVMPEEQEGSSAFAYNWNELLKLYHHHYNNLTLPRMPLQPYLLDIMNIIWDQVCNCLKDNLSSNSDLVLRGFQILARLSYQEHSTKHLDEVITLIWNSTSIKEALAAPQGNQIPKALSKSDTIRKRTKILIQTFRKYGNLIGNNGWKVFVNFLAILTHSNVFNLALLEEMESIELDKEDVTATATNSNNPTLLPSSSSPRITATGSIGTNTASAITTATSGTSTDHHRTSQSSFLSTIGQYILPLSNKQEISSLEAEYRTKATEFINSCEMSSLFSDTRFFEPKTLLTIIDAFISVLIDSKALLIQIKQFSINLTDATRILLLEILVHITWENRERMDVLWEKMVAIMTYLATEDTTTNITIKEHAILGLGRLSLSSYKEQYQNHRHQHQHHQQNNNIGDESNNGNDEFLKNQFKFTELLSNLPKEGFQNILQPAFNILSKLIEMTVKRDSKLLQLEMSIWPHIFACLSKSTKLKMNSLDPSFSLLSLLVQEEILFPMEFFPEYVDLASSLISSSSLMIGGNIINNNNINPDPNALSMSVALKVLSKLTDLQTIILKTNSSTEKLDYNSWSEFIIPVYSAIAQQSCHYSREIRQTSQSYLQRLILAVNFQDYELAFLIDVFDLVLFPLLEELVRPELKGPPERIGLDETRMRAASIVCKIYLQNIPILFDNDGNDADGHHHDHLKHRDSGDEKKLMDLWETLLKRLLKFLMIPSDILKESIPESIKNMLLVLASNDILKPSDVNDPFSQKTWSILDGILPDMQQELFKLINVPSKEEGKEVESSNTSTNITAIIVSNNEQEKSNHNNHHDHNHSHHETNGMAKNGNNEEKEPANHATITSEENTESNNNQSNIKHELLMQKSGSTTVI